MNNLVGRVGVLTCGVRWRELEQQNSVLSTFSSEFRSCVKVEVAVMGSQSLISLVVFVDV